MQFLKKLFGGQTDEDQPKALAQEIVEFDESNLTQRLKAFTHHNNFRKQMKLIDEMLPLVEEFLFCGAAVDYLVYNGKDPSELGNYELKRVSSANSPGSDWPILYHDSGLLDKGKPSGFTWGSNYETMKRDIKSYVEDNLPSSFILEDLMLCHQAKKLGAEVVVLHSRYTDTWGQVYTETNCSTGVALIKTEIPFAYREER